MKEIWDLEKLARLSFICLVARKMKEKSWDWKVWFSLSTGMVDQVVLLFTTLTIPQFYFQEGKKRNKVIKHVTDINIFGIKPLMGDIICYQPDNEPGFARLGESNRYKTKTSLCTLEVDVFFHRSFFIN